MALRNPSCNLHEEVEGDYGRGWGNGDSGLSLPLPSVLLRNLGLVERGKEAGELSEKATSGKGRAVRHSKLEFSSSNIGLGTATKIRNLKCAQHDGCIKKEVPQTIKTVRVSLSYGQNTFGHSVPNTLYLFILKPLFNNETEGKSQKTQLRSCSIREPLM